jgi:hypothetical protein
VGWPALSTLCIDCGREIASATIRGAWRCQTCVNWLKEHPYIVPESTPHTEPPPAAAAGEIVAPERDSLPVPPPVAAGGRVEPTWRELGHWLGLAEGGDNATPAQQAAGALRLYFLHQMDLPLWAAPELTMLRGKLYMSAALLRYLADRSGYRVVRVESSDESCTATIVHKRTGETVGSSTFTLADAKRAGLIRTGSAWQTYPERMLWARASTFAIRDHLPEVGIGLGAEDERFEVLGQVAPLASASDDLMSAEGDEEIPF